MIEITLPIVLQILQTVALIVGIAYYLFIMKNSQKNQQMQLETRQVQLFMQIYEKINSEETLKSFMELVNLEPLDNEVYLQKYDSAVNPAHYAKRAHIWYNYNSMGELLRMGFVDPELLAQLQLDSQVILMWEKWEQVIKETRMRENIPDIWEGFEYLYNEMKKLRDKKGFPQEITLTKLPST